MFRGPARAGLARRAGRLRALPWICLLLAACTSHPDPVFETPTRAVAPEATSLPPMRVFAVARPTPPQRSNHDMARDFLDLSFELESGRSLPRFTRFEGPITLRVIGQPPPTMMADLARVLARLRSEAGLDIRQVSSGGASITIEAVSGAEIRRHLPTAACFVVPNITRLGEYRAARNRGATDWTQLDRRERIAVFVPNDASPQETRDCLHEELAQALGPLNDLYRLPDSVFNDDNVHAVLTGFDMLILRAYYSGDLRSGMTRAEVAARLPGILARLNPAGERIASRPAGATPRAWVDAIQTALGPGAGPAARRSAAMQALRIARAEGWQDHRLGFSHFALGRLLQSSDGAAAAGHFAAAHEIYERDPALVLHRAFTAGQLAAYELSRGRAEPALGWIARHPETAERHENAALLATLMLLQAEALDLSGRPAEAQAVRLDSLGWARYGYGSDAVVRAKLVEVRALSPLRGPRG